jgi:putative ATP-dependent endonuclease of OLD family
VELRRIGYHLGAHRGAACFARLWLLVEGESEMWMLPQLARLCGYEFGVEGVECVEFAQSGLAPMIRVAEQLGIGWHVLADGDKAGQTYIDTLRRTVPSDERRNRFTLLKEPDIEHCFYRHGYAGVYREHARLSGKAVKDSDPQRVIQRAVQSLSKPDLALRVVEAVAAEGSPGVPDVLKKMIRTCVHAARAQSK